jgi:hypothetical protein
MEPVDRWAKSADYRRDRLDPSGNPVTGESGSHRFSAAHCLHGRLAANALKSLLEARSNIVGEESRALN